MSGNIQTLASTQIAAGGGNGLLTGLVSYYKLDEASGDAADAHGSNTLAQNGTVGATTGIINGARSSASTVDYLKIDPTPAGLQNADMSFSFWVNASAWTVDQGLFGITNGPLWTNGVGVHVSSGPKLRFWAGGSYSAQYVETSGNVSTSTTYHLVGTYNGTTKEHILYLNGSSQGSRSDGGALDYTSTLVTVLYMATSQTPAYWIDEMGLWSRVLSGADVTAIYNSGACLPYGSYAS